MEVIEQEKFRTILKNKTKEITERKRRSHVGMVEATGSSLPASDEGEKADSSHQLSVNLNLYELSDQVLKNIDRAIQRIDQRTFGECACGNDISAERLRAVPWADKCLSCQEAEENLANPCSSIKRAGVEVGLSSDKDEDGEDNEDGE